MKRKAIFRSAFLALLAAVTTLMLSGCDKYTKHRILTFFFTGVPPIDGGQQVQKRMTQAELAKHIRKRRKKREESNIPAYQHGPFAANQCNQCHATASSATFRKDVKNISGISGTLKGGISARLVLPLRDLCIDCHAAKAVEAAFRKGLWVHGPVSRGICTVCHSPHQSPYKAMLLDGDTRDMCRKCHMKGFITETEDHLRDVECTECHNPHMGKDRFLLKKDFKENQ
jgi:predicted CXXCH cytochrome family protein